MIKKVDNSLSTDTTSHFVTLLKRNCQGFMHVKQNKPASCQRAHGTTSSSPLAYFPSWYFICFYFFLQIFILEIIYFVNGEETINTVFV